MPFSYRITASICLNAMISSKNINVIAISLTALVLVIMVCAMFLPKAVLTGNDTGIYNYSDLHKVNFTADDYYTDYAKGSIAKISLKGTSAESASPNVEINNGDVTILGGGVYVLSGELSDGTVTVDAADDAEVRLVLNGASITSSDFSALYVKQAKKTIISLVDGTENCLTDASVYNESKTENSKPTAALYSKDDLVINGNGSLIINGNYNDGVKVNDTLKITEGSVRVTSVDDGINVNDFIAVLDADIVVDSGGDAVKCDHENEEKGFIAFEGTALTITSDGDGVTASSAVYANNVNANIVCGGGSGISDSGFGSGNEKHRGISDMQENSPSTKAIKCGTELMINGGTFKLDSKDDALHSNGNVVIEKGSFSISTNDDAVHADMALTVNPVLMNIVKCYEGLEGAYITVNGGEISIVSQDDGINATGEKSENAFMVDPVNRGHNGNFSEEKTSDEDIWLTINGGHIHIETSGDGFDSNGSAVINGGYMEIYGPEDNGNGSIDVGDGGYVLIMNGGKLFAAGSSGMAEHPTESSKQNTIVFYLDEKYRSGSKIILLDGDGNKLLSAASRKSFDWLCYSDENLKQGDVYTLLIDGNEIASITVEGKISQFGERNFGGEKRGFGGTERGINR